MAAAQVIEADNEKTLGVEWSSRANNVVPPTDVVGRIGVMAGNVVMAGQGVTNEDGVRFGGVERAVGLVDQIVGRQNAATAKVQRLVEVGAL